MSNEEKLSLCNKVVDGLRRGHERMLRRKALLARSIVVAAPDGMPREVPAKDALKKHLKSKA